MAGFTIIYPTLEQYVEGRVGYNNVNKTLFDANTILKADTDNAPEALTVAEQTVVGRLTGGNIDDLPIGISDDNILQVDGSPNDDEYARFTANGLEGRTTAETIADLGLDARYDLETIIPAASAKTTPVSDDLFNLLDSADSYSLKKVTWWNVRNTLKTYFDLVYVQLTTDQTIAGVKTFSSFPVTPSSAPTTDYEVANKKYVDDNAGGGQYRLFAWEAVTGGGWTFVSDGANSPSLILEDLE